MQGTRLTCSTAEVSRLMGVERHCIGRLAKGGQLPGAFLIGGRWYFKKGPLAKHLGVSIEELNRALVGAMS